jgi:hypothetical protein
MSVASHAACNRALTQIKCSVSEDADGLPDLPTKVRMCAAAASTMLLRYDRSNMALQRGAQQRSPSRQEPPEPGPPLRFCRRMPSRQPIVDRQLPTASKGPSSMRATYITRLDSDWALLQTIALDGNAFLCGMLSPNDERQHDENADD